MPLRTPPPKTGVLCYHFVGIGGCGMSALAQVLAQRGHKVTGSDMADSAVVERLGKQGIHVNIGHLAGTLPATIDCMVVSAAIKEDNPEVVCGRQHGVRVLKYAELLGELSREMDTLAVAGTHGKSTTSAWLAYALKNALRDPSFVIGAEVEQLGGSSGAGNDRQLVVEACEYDRSFLKLRPTTAAILNIECDHLDYYRDLEEIIASFRAFAELAESEGLVVANADDDNVMSALAGLDIRCEYFSTAGDGNNTADTQDSTPDGPANTEMNGPAHRTHSGTPVADWRAENLHYEQGYGCFDLEYRGGRLGSVRLGLAGKHNVSNALATAALGRSAGLSDEQICTALEGFVGVSRRMSYKGEVAGVVVVDDYAHHPTEIRTTLEAIAANYRPGRIWCVFQPHQHSRTRFLLEEFASSFGVADIVLLPDIYFVRDSEEMRRAVRSEELAQKIAGTGGRAHYLGDFGRIVEYLSRELQVGDLVVTMGAGDVWKVADELVCRLGRNS